MSKKIVDTEIAKLDGANALLLNGSKPMTGNLNKITGYGSASQGDSGLTLGSARPMFLPFDGSRAMEGDLDKNNP